MPTFGEVLKAAREATKLTQHQVAAKAGLSQAAVSKAELAATADDAGRKETLEKIASALGLTIETIVRSAAQAPATPSSTEAEPPEGVDDIPWESTSEPLDPKEIKVRRRAESLQAGWWYTRKYPNDMTVSYLADVIGRNFTHPFHKITDSHAFISMLENYNANTSGVLSLPNHYSYEADLGTRILLSAMGMLRASYIERTFPNLVLAMIVAAGRESVDIIQHPESHSIPDVVRDDEGDIPF